MSFAALRIALACGTLSTWLVSLAAGWVFGGWIHLLLAAAVVVVPWRAIVAEHQHDLAERDGAAEPSPEPDGLP